MLMILLSTLSVLRETVDWGKMWFGKAGKTQFVSLDWSHNFGAIDVLSGLVLLLTTLIFRISYRNGYVTLLVLHLLPLRNPWLIVEL